MPPRTRRSPRQHPVRTRHPRYREGGYERGKGGGLERGRGAPQAPDRFIITGAVSKRDRNGNLYHSGEIIDVYTNEVVATIPRSHGGDDMLKQNAYKALVKAGLANESDRFNHSLNRERFNYAITEGVGYRPL